LRHDPGGPEHGHLFHLSVTHRGTHRVVGDPIYHEADWWSEPWTLDVRAWSLPEAIRKAALHEFSDWTPPPELEEQS